LQSAYLILFFACKSTNPELSIGNRFPLCKKGRASDYRAL